MYKIITTLSVLLLIQINYCFSDYKISKDEPDVKGGYKSCKIIVTICDYDGILDTNNQWLFGENRYNDSGYIVEEIINEKDGTKYRTERKYNEADYLIEETEYLHDGKFVRKYIQNLDTNGYIVKAWVKLNDEPEYLAFERISLNNGISIAYQNEKNELNKNITKTYYNDFGNIDSTIYSSGIHRFKYDKNGNEIENSFYDKNDSIVYSLIYKFNEKQQQIESYRIQYQGPFTGTGNKSYFKYDENGFRIENWVKNGDEIQTKTTCKYDHFGNILQMIVYDERGLCDHKLYYVYSY